MGWDWIYRMLGMPVRPGEQPTATAHAAGPKPEPRRLRPLAEAEPEARGVIRRTGPAPSFVIEYVDRAGMFTRRRITVRRVTASVDEWGNQVCKLFAWCHLRDDEREFNVERIRAIVDDDGVVHTDPVAYLSAALGADLGAALGR